jgi:hypothetical protein
MREVLVGQPREGSEPVLAVAVPGPDVETARWGFEGDPVHLVPELGPGVAAIYFSNGPPPVEPPDKPVRDIDEAPRDDTSTMLLLLCE